MSILLDDLLNDNAFAHMIEQLGILRYPGETDQHLRERFTQYIKYQHPDPRIQRLLYLVYRLGLNSPKQFLPAGI